MIGSLSVVGLGPGDQNLITPEVSLAMLEASDLIGYGPYLNRLHIFEYPMGYCGTNSTYNNILHFNCRKYLHN